MNSDEALALAYERAGGMCECIGGGCLSLTHRPGVNRCAGQLRSLRETSFFVAARFADRTKPENIYALCGACAENPRRQSQRIRTALPAEPDAPPELDRR